jgi:hypothetical protein
VNRPSFAFAGTVFGKAALAVVLTGALGVSALGVLASATGCNSVDNGSIQIITDEDAGTFTEAPVPTELQVAAVSADASTILATAQLPTSSIDLGTLSESAPVVSLNVTGLDATNTRRVFGASLPTQYATLAGQTIPLFVQRTGEFARLPGPLTDSRPSPVLSVIQGEFLLVAGGSSASLAATTQLFDFGAFAAYGAPPTLPAAPQSIAVSGTVAWLINASGGTYFDFSSSAYGPIAAPAGGSFADIAGGATVIDATGAQYIVGGTRTSGAATARVLKVDPNDLSNTSYPYGNATWLTLANPRLGAAATWVDPLGLVVIGGNTSPSGNSVEIANSTFTSTAASLPADLSIGVGAAALDAQHVLLAGGLSTSFQDPGTRVLDLGCTPSASASCVTAWTPGLPTVLGTAQTFVFTATDALVVGNEFISGKTRAFRLGPMTTTEVVTKVPHVNATAVWSPVGSIALFGGANMIESFVP